ncbi:16931_t:CDS:1 [Funneliformis geosporum]|uniref:16931_t:CDS:1 n=1 Tax=Funneliformis geosporum TaxID=1117311 RepID=A0A9W4WM59_9GLOM|nr:16931_t:CDS:1 [Funneliformis geosporum]
MNSFNDQIVDNKFATKSKRGRKSLAVSEDYVDTTGRTHIMTVRRANLPVQKKKASKVQNVIKKSNNNNYSRQYEQNEEFNDVLKDRIGNLESLVNKSTNATKHNNAQINPHPLSNIGTEELFNLSKLIGNELLQRSRIQTATPTTTIGVINDRINTTIPQSLSNIGTVVPLEIQSQLQTPMLTSTTAPIDILINRIGKLESLLNKFINSKIPQSLSNFDTEVPVEMQSQMQLQAQMESPTTTPIDILYDRIEKLESLINMYTNPTMHQSLSSLSYIGENSFDMLHLQNQIVSPTTSLTSAYDTDFYQQIGVHLPHNTNNYKS